MAISESSHCPRLTISLSAGKSALAVRLRSTFGRGSHGYIVVDGNKNNLGFARPAYAASRFLEYLRRYGGRAESSKITELASAAGLLVLLCRVQFLAKHFSSPVRYRL